MRIFVILAAICLSVGAGSVLAEKRPEHYEGKSAASLEEALANLGEANRAIAGLLQDGAAEPAELAELHRITYTAENALEKVSEELIRLQALLETLHLSSEAFDEPAVLRAGPRYLENSKALLGR